MKKLILSIALVLALPGFSMADCSSDANSIPATGLSISNITDYKPQFTNCYNGIQIAGYGEVTSWPPSSSNEGTFAPVQYLNPTTGYCVTYMTLTCTSISAVNSNPVGVIPSTSASFWLEWPLGQPSNLTALGLNNN